MTVNDLILKLQSLTDEERDKNIYYFDNSCREEVKYIIVTDRALFISHKMLWNKKPA